jgi:hypothetical protein
MFKPFQKTKDNTAYNSIIRGTFEISFLAISYIIIYLNLILKRNLIDFEIETVRFSNKVFNLVLGEPSKSIFLAYILFLFFFLSLSPSHYRF